MDIKRDGIDFLMAPNIMAGCPSSPPLGHFLFFKTDFVHRIEATNFQSECIDSFEGIMYTINE